MVGVSILRNRTPGAEALLSMPPEWQESATKTTFTPFLSASCIQPKTSSSRMRSRVAGPTGTKRPLAVVDADHEAVKFAGAGRRADRRKEEESERSRKALATNPALAALMHWNDSSVTSPRREAALSLRQRSRRSRRHPFPPRPRRLPSFSSARRPAAAAAISDRRRWLNDLQA